MASKLRLSERQVERKTMPQDPMDARTKMAPPKSAKRPAKRSQGRR